MKNPIINLHHKEKGQRKSIMKEQSFLKSFFQLVGSSLVMMLAMRYLSIPVPYFGIRVQFAYGILVLISVLYGPALGTSAAFIGHYLSDILMESVWLSWILCSALLAGVFTISVSKKRLNRGIFTRNDAIRFNVIQVAGNLVIWGLLAPTLDVFMYSEATSKVFTQGWAAGLANALTVGLVGSLLIMIYVSYVNKQKNKK